MPMARKITRIGIPRREEKELNKILQVTSTEPKINRLITAAASNVVRLLLPENGETHNRSVPEYAEQLWFKKYILTAEIQI
jgi:hypothetical protein